MRLIPVSLLVRGQFSEDDHAQLRDATVSVGQRYEVDLDRLTTELAERVLGQTARPGKPVRIKVRTATQSTSKNKADLNSEYEALRDLGGVGEVLSQATQATVEVDAVKTACALAGAELLSEDPLKVRFTFPPTHLPEPLGGVAYPGEVRREVEVWFNHAPWRDRRVRRVARVECYAVVS